MKNPPSKKVIERRTEIQDALVHIGLARMFVDMERDADAASELDLVDSILKGSLNYYKTSRMILRGRLAVRTGAYETVYQEMEKSIYIYN